jgi:PadR family transcriptional regulator PadR
MAGLRVATRHAGAALALTANRPGADLRRGWSIALRNAKTLSFHFCNFSLHFSYNFLIVEDMRKREYLGQLELMVLFAVMRPARDAYGVLISREIAEKSGRDVALASVYAALERLERKGFVTSSLGEPTAERGGRARTYFEPTAAGLREARGAHKTLLRLSSGLPALKARPA